MKKIPLFPKHTHDKKWGQFMVNCPDDVAPIMEKIIAGTSGLVRLDDFEAIAKILHKELKCPT
jgi:hypothetical protein